MSRSPFILLAIASLLVPVVACDKLSGGSKGSASASASAAALPAPVATVSAKPEPKYTGSYVQTALKTSSSGAAEAEKNEVSTLVLDDAQVVWTQTFGGKTVVETYTYTPTNVTKTADGVTIAVTYKGIDIKGGYGYNPDSGDPKLEITRVDGNWTLAISYKDTAGTVSKHSFNQIAAAK